MCIERATYGATYGATYDALILLRFRVDWTRETPSYADSILLNAALHVEGRHDLVQHRTTEEQS